MGGFFMSKECDLMICDVSKHQGSIDWDKLSPHLDFVVIKASGKYANGTDPFYAQNVTGAMSHGVPFHVFHFLYCMSEAEARRDAGLFYRSVAAQGHWPLSWALDCEAGWGIANSKARSVAEAFENELRRLARENGPGEILVGMYVAHEKYEPYGFDYSRYDYVWIPRYGGNDGTIDGSIKPSHQCDLWQYTSHGRLPGIDGDVDLDVLTGSKPMEFFTGKTNGGEIMAQRMPIKQFVAELEAALNRKDGYIMGSYGQNPRTGYLDLSVPESKCKAAWKPTGYYYNQYKDNDKQHAQALKWREKCTRVWDCNGMAEGIYELFSGECINSKARYNYAQWCDPKGNGMIPVEYRVPGAAVFWSNTPKSKPTSGNIHHVAYLYKPVVDGHPEGDWYIIEAKGVMYGVVKSKLYSRKPNFWGLMTKYFDYSDVPTPTPEPDVLKKGDKGPAVKEMQLELLKWNASCLPKYGADGDFGTETENAVRAFQKAAGLPVTGVYDAATKEALIGWQPTPMPQKVVVTGAAVNVRSAPGATGTRVLGIVHKGDELPYQGESRDVGGTPWYLVIYQNQNGWISGKYSKVI